MIFFNTETEFSLNDEAENVSWLMECVSQESKKQGEINYIFCKDAYLSELNVKYLKHNELTDIISFDYTIGNIVSGDIFISIERVQDNAKRFGVSFKEELHRVMVHGVLHFCGYKDKTKEEKRLMRAKEDYYLSLRTFNIEGCST